MGKLLQDGHKENVSYRNLEEEELYITVLRIRFGEAYENHQNSDYTKN
jgi:hypothetical protein